MGTPGKDIGLAMTLITTCLKEYKSRRMVLDISDEMIIRYPVSKLNDDKGEEEMADSDNSMEDPAGDGEGDNDSEDDDDIDDDLQ